MRVAAKAAGVIRADVRHVEIPRTQGNALWKKIAERRRIEDERVKGEEVPHMQEGDDRMGNITVHAGVVLPAVDADVTSKIPVLEEDVIREAVIKFEGAAEEAQRLLFDDLRCLMGSVETITCKVLFCLPKKWP